jgi:hypothetical protein
MYVKKQGSQAGHGIEHEFENQLWNQARLAKFGSYSRKDLLLQRKDVWSVPEHLLACHMFFFIIFLAFLFLAYIKCAVLYLWYHHMGVFCQFSCIYMCVLTYFPNVFSVMLYYVLGLRESTCHQHFNFYMVDEECH